MTALMVTLDLRIDAARRVYGAAGDILMRLCSGCVLVDDCVARDRFVESGRHPAIVGWIEYDRWFRGDKCPEAAECRARITDRDLADYRAAKRDRTFRPRECRQLGLF